MSILLSLWEKGQHRENNSYLHSCPSPMGMSFPFDLHLEYKNEWQVLSVLLPIEAKFWYNTKKNYLT
jgi:hypothetical protein